MHKYRPTSMHQRGDKLHDSFVESDMLLSVGEPSQKSQENEKKLQHLTSVEKSVVVQN